MCAAALIGAPSALAETVHVTTDASSGPGSLQAAIDQVNAGSDPSNRILIDDLGPNAEIKLHSNPVFLTDITIKGPGAKRLTIRFARYGFQSVGDLTVRRLTLTGASGLKGPIPASSQQRPLIADGRAVTLDRTVVRGNHAVLRRTTDGNEDELDSLGLFNANGPFTMLHSHVIDNSIDVTVSGESNSGVFVLGGILEGSRDDFLMRRSEISHNRISLSAPETDAFLRPSLLDIFAPATIVDSSISGNTSTVDAGGRASVSGVILFSAASSITNSTIADNFGRAHGDEPSVSPAVQPIFALSVKNSTIAGNRGTEGANLGGSTDGATISNSIIANPRGSANCAGGNFISAGFNLGTDGSCGLDKGTDLERVPALLRPLGDYGGPAETVALSPNSPAVDAGRSGALDRDQRGFERTVDTSLTNAPGSNGTDIGAFELRTLPTCAGRAPTIATHPSRTTRGTAGRDVILGSNARFDTIAASAGRDLVCGRGGTDFISGGGGNDVVHGGGAFDGIVGGKGRDLISGGSGRDILLGALGRDRLFGGAGNDFLYGGTDRDACRGGEGRDKRFSCES